MRRIIFLVLMLAGAAALAQKQQKPNTAKALKLMQEGKLNEAKDMIDAATTYEKTMNDGNTWYYRGLIYTAIDTTSNEAFKSLDPQPLKVALESFAKADQMAKAGKEYFVMPEGTFQPVTKTQQMEMLANYYLDKGIKQFQDEADNEAAIRSLKKTELLINTQFNEKSRYANDTLTYYVTALVAQQSDSLDLAVASANKYLEKGGKGKDAHLILYQIYNSGPMENKDKALEVVRNARKALPNNPDFPKLEIGMLIDMGKIAEAKTSLEEALKTEPDNKILHFYLGYTNSKTENMEEAKKNFNNALRIDPGYFDAQYYLAQLYLIDANKIRDQLKSLGMSAADKKKAAELDKQLVEKFKIALPYWEKAEKLNPKDTDVLERLRTIYYYLGDDTNEARTGKRLKELGADTDN
jgi:tetratricopeptide (TPR) repeat protein